MINIIAGGAGFIGINLIKKLSAQNSQIYILDNLSNSSKKELNNLIKLSNIHFMKCDLSIQSDLNSILKKICENNNCDITLWHLAANSNIPGGINNPEIDLKDTFQTTFCLVEACKKFRIKNFIFASSSAIYGNHGDLTIKEDTGPLIPISNYGAMKLASEAVCFAAYESHLQNLRIYRFPNVVGIPPTHGVILDLVNKLKINPKVMQVLGDGFQEKSYLHVEDLINGMILLNKVNLKSNDNPIFNLGLKNDTVKINWLAEEVIKQFSPGAKAIYGKRDRGWDGDVPKFKYDTSKAISYGWEPQLNSKEAVSKAINQIINY